MVSYRYDWAKDGFGDLLMMALPHHMDTIETEWTSVVMEDSYQTIKVTCLGRHTGRISRPLEKAPAPSCGDNQ